MVYILNTEISEHKKTEVAIQQIFGIGKNRSVQICKQIGLTKNSSIKSLSN
jgi:ribosomal protein S13